MITTVSILNKSMEGNIFLSDTCCRIDGGKMQNLYWRDNILWCTYPLLGYPRRFSLKIKTTGDREDRSTCERLGAKIIELLRSRHIDGTLFNYKEFKLRSKNGTLFESVKEKKAHYNPKYWRLVARYWWFHLKHTKSGQSEKYHLIHSLKRFGSRYALEIEPYEVENWLKGMKGTCAINTINLRLSYMQATYNHANIRENKFKINYNPTRNIKKVKGGNVRNFLLTPEMFERNYSFLNKDHPLFAIYYLALWETGRRPAEVAQYRWEWYSVEDRSLSIPAEYIKGMKEPEEIPISQRLHDALMRSERRQGLMFPGNLGNPFFYWTKDGQQRNNHYRYMKLLRDKFGANSGVTRDTRRGFVSRKLDKEGHRLEDVMMLTGHRTHSMAKRYRVETMDTKRKVIDSVLDIHHKNVVQFQRKVG